MTTKLIASDGGSSTKRESTFVADFLFKKTRESGTVEVGIIDAGKHLSGDITVAGIGFAHEFGATIKHPGGTSYIIQEGGKALFVKEGTPGIKGVTKPHDIVIPERSFIRSTLRENKKKILDFKVKLAAKILKGEMSTEKALGLIGQFVADLIKRKIVSLRSPPNKAATIRKKKSSNPLIDTGQLKNSITYKVNL